MSGSTRERLLDATLKVVSEQGIAKASARTIAAAAGVNQALVFYHFGSVEDLLGAACEHGARARVEANRAALGGINSLSDLVTVARQIHDRERTAGNVALLGQLLAGASSHPALARPTASGLRLWIDEVERVLTRVLEPTPLPQLIDIPGLARAISAAFVGLELYEGVDTAGADQALTALDRLAALLMVLTDLSPLEQRALGRRLRRG